MIEITAEINCIHSFDRPSYRLYIDNDLITERTWIWDHNHTKIEEHIFVSIEPGIHTVRVEGAYNPRSIRFNIGTICVEGKPVHHQNGVFEYRK